THCRLRAWTLAASDPTFTLKGLRIESVLYPVEDSRGYQARVVLWSPGYFKLTLSRGERATLVASSESFETMKVRPPHQALDAERRRPQRLIAAAVPEARAG